MRILLKISPLLGILVAGLFVLLSLLFAGMQTKWAKQEFKNWIISCAKQQGIDLNIRSIEGNLPFKWTLYDVHCQIEPGISLESKAIKIRAAFFPLLRKELKITYLTLLETNVVYSDTASLPPKHFPLSFPLPFNLSISSMKVEDLCVVHKETQESGIFSVLANGKYKKKGKFFFLDLKIFSSSTSSAEFVLKGDKARDEVNGWLKMDIKSTQVFQPFFSPSFDSDFLLESHFFGPWNFWKNSSALNGTIKGRCNKMEIPGFKALNRRWLLESSFTFDHHQWDISSFTVKSNLLELRGNATLDTALHPIAASYHFSLPQLSLLNLYSPIFLQGSVQGSAQYDEQAALLEFYAGKVKIGNLIYDEIEGMIQAAASQGIWKGHLEFLAKHLTVPLESSGTFTLDPQSALSIKEFSLKGAEMDINGYLTLHLPDRTMEGAFLGHILHLSRFAELSPKSYLEGNLGLELQFTRETQPSLQRLHLHLLFKNFRYSRLSTGELSLDAQIIDPFGSPFGSLSLEAEKTFFAPLFLSSFSLETSWDGKQWPFHLLAKGEWKKPLEIDSSGFWFYNRSGLVYPNNLKNREFNKEAAPIFYSGESDTVREQDGSEDKKFAAKPTPLKTDFSGCLGINFNTLQGTLLNQAFALDKPFSIQKSPDSFKVSDCAITLASGNIFLNMDFNPTSSQAKVEAEHFPLDLLLVSHPTLALSGTTSLSGDFLATPVNMEGKLNLSLEGLDVFQYGKTTPFKAKGTLQAHLDQNRLQFHAYATATDQQFLDVSASLPIRYAVFPFHIEVEDQADLSSELTLEGNLEDIFDFINIGPHRATGLLSCHLFLSKTLASPSLRGAIELQNGSYENYFTGTLLKDIQATATTENKELTLSSFRAKDDREGSVTAQGQLFLDRKENFPYLVEAQLSHLNTLKFDSMTAQFTGPLNIAGNSETALATGKLDISSAYLQIQDVLPIDLPILPIVYLNPPAHLDSNAIKIEPIFPFHMDLDLTTAAPLKVRGRGLSSEWTGNVHLSGTNANVGASGKLNLSRGEFIFAGKVFTLNTGEITFTDKPTQQAYIHNLNGTMTLQDLTIIAILNGPLTSPQLTFQSMPHLPTSSILARILFNKDISEISPPQAIQLAQMIVSLSGGAGPDVLEKIRRSLGVDRLNIVSSTSDPDQVCVQIGKYLTRGVLVTLSQGVDSSQITVEVELGKGFLLQAETQEEGDEQGAKFSLKWNHNY